ncbi:MAG TPA: NPCBM/NEW2 domain-containing protein [Gemmataceae bacterium]|nr:NPCBM/NEW2 domain-containing protein [Gemmataceae bacterium]
MCAALAEEPSSPVFILRTADGESLTGPLRQLGDRWSVRLGEHEAAGDNVVALRRDDLPMPPFPAGEQLLFANGDRLAAHVLGLRGERLEVRLPPGLGGDRPVTLPLSAVSVVWLGAPDDADDPAGLRRRLASDRRSRDRVLLRNGDALEGVFDGMDEKAVRVEVEQKPVSVARGKVAAVALSTELAESLKPRGPYARLVLAGGSRVSLAKATCDGAALTGTTLFDAPVRVPLAQVAALYVYQGRAVYLSDLKPRRVEQTKYLDVNWPPVADGSVAGRDLRLAGGTYDKGLGLHSGTRVTYDLAGGYRRFEARVGLDDQTGRRGSVRVRVLADGKPLDVGWDRELMARDGAVPIHADVRGARELTLAVEFGQGGDVQDDVDWVDARLVK